ncbi:hypothetical protein CREGCYN_09790 [Synechococcus sp. M16CYN]
MYQKPPIRRQISRALRPTKKVPPSNTNSLRVCAIREKGKAQKQHLDESKVDQ